jgi:hypothetical protein
MRNAARSIAGVAVALAAAGFSGHGSAQAAPQTEPVCAACCYHPQSPRSLTAADWDWTSRVPTVSRHTTDSIDYVPRPGVRLTLHRCSQHYHCRIENVQACPKQSAAPAEGECPKDPPVGSWVEIHTVYHQGPALNPLPEPIDRCGPGPLVVVGYHAKVTSAASRRPPVPQHFGPPSAEWSGSATNVDPPPPAPPDCKAAAFWSFALGCDFEVSTEQLRPFTHPDGARALQPKNRLSHDLTHIVGPSKHP